MHEVKGKAGLAPPAPLDVWVSNKLKLKSFCDTPGHSWDPYQAVACKKVVGRVRISVACCTSSTPIIGLHGLMVFIYCEVLGTFLVFPLLWFEHASRRENDMLLSCGMGCLFKMWSTIFAHELVSSCRTCTLQLGLTWHGCCSLEGFAWCTVHVDKPFCSLFGCKHWPELVGMPSGSPSHSMCSLYGWPLA